MGNCQAVDAAALVIQHPTGRIERLYWPVMASEVMRTNPGHYVSLIIPLPSSSSPEKDEEDAEKSHPGNKKSVRFTRVKLLRPNETLALGHAYRLVTSQEVMKVLKAKKYAKMKGQRPESDRKPSMDAIDNGEGCQKLEEIPPEVKHGKHRPRAAPTNSAVGRPRSWRPSLNSISEGGS